jgi:chorismate--pyruvate lyase
MKYLARRARSPDAGGWTALPPMADHSLRLRRLLAERASLTAALQRHGNTTVSVLRQRLARPDADELRLMRIRPHQLRMVREVVLRVDGMPWVFAHTVANAPGQALMRRAGRRPLATVLFADPKVRARTLHYRHIDRRHPLFTAAAIWSPRSAMRFVARRAVFERGAARLLVTEVFLLP